jgi:arylsulfatase A-like enzyme
VYPTDNGRAGTARLPIRSTNNATSATSATSRWKGLAPFAGRGIPLVWMLALAFAGQACSPEPAAVPEATDEAARPNVLFVVWDTVRSDRMSLYGHDRQTTPALDAWATQALVFEDVTSAAGYTVPSHGSMFTGRLPSEHCASGDHAVLDESNVTLAELMRDAGYETFLYSENPHLSEASKFAQGFERVEHPWSDQHVDRAVEILRSKVEGDRSSELASRALNQEAGDRKLSAWNVKAAGELAETALADFLADKSADKPFFAFVNYMEAHRPFIPPRRFREKFLDAKDVDASYLVDRSWNALWEYTFGEREFSEHELELTRATYDAAILELDELFASLLASLEASGDLENTVVVLTADHGEHLGDHHMFDHQASLHEAVLRVPLLIYHPRLVAPGRRSDPAMNFDVFSSLLALTEIPAPTGVSISSRNLFAPIDPSETRGRLAEETTAEGTGVQAMKRLHPGWNAAPWIRTQRALYSGRYKWVESSPGEPEMYDLRADPGELRNLAALRAIDASAMRDALAAAEEKLVGACAEHDAGAVSAEDTELLKALGYVPEDEAPH